MSSSLSTSPSTRLFGLIGHPVSHSLSPALHSAAFRAAGLDACYLAFDVEAADLEDALRGARALGVAGLNVTVPHKERALALARSADPTAELVGAANTLAPQAGGGWRAHNTDVSGFLRALETDLEFRPDGRRCLVLGAGGAARAAIVGLAREGAQEILVANRNEERAWSLVTDLEGKVGPGRLRGVPLDGAPERLEPGDLLVSATPLGLRPDGRWPWDPERFSPGLAVFDMAYRAGEETGLARQARERGLRAVSGGHMLLFQGALSFSLWTGLPAPLQAMGEALAAAG